jgi:hypothetical protein
MSFPILQKYLARLSDATGAASSIWLDHEGKAQGRFFNCTMTSAFQPIRQLDSGAVLAYEGWRAACRRRIRAVAVEAARPRGQR